MKTEKKIWPYMKHRMDAVPKNASIIFQLHMVCTKKCLLKKYTSLDHIKNKFGRIKNKKLPSLPTGQLAWKEREKRGKGLPVAVCMALIVPFNVVSIF